MSDPTTPAIDPIELASTYWRRSGWDDAVEGMSVVHLVMRVQQLLLGHAARYLRPFGLTFSRFEVLRVIAFSSTGAVQMGVLSSRLQVHAASATNAVTRLEQAGLVERVMNPADRRSVEVYITDEGRRVVDEATKVLNDQVFATLPVSDTVKGELIKYLSELRSGLEAQN